MAMFSTVAYASDYACSTSEFDPYVKSLSGLTPYTRIIDSLKISCTDTINLPSNMVTYLQVGTVYKIKLCGTFRCWSRTVDYYSLVCVKNETRIKNGIPVFYPSGVWGARVYPNSTLDTNGMKCGNPLYCNPLDPKYTTFWLTDDDGTCYKKAIV